MNKKAIKNITVQWNWNGDFNALQGFNIALTPENETPHTKAFTTIYVPKNMLNTEQDTFSYTIANVTLDLNQKVIAWVQTVYVENDSDWVSQSGIVVTDDGNATIATGSEINSIQQTITQINVNVNNIQTKISTIESDLNSYSEQLSEFQQTVDGFRTTVANYEEDVEGYRQQVSQFNQTVEGFLTQVSRYEEDVEGYNQQLSQITQTTNEIRAEVFDSNGNSKIKQLSDSIELMVTREEFDNLTIGGRNLILNGNFENGTTDNWNYIGSASREVVNIDGEYWMHISQNDSESFRGIRQDVDVFEKNTPYILTFKAFRSSSYDGGIRIIIHQYGDGNNSPQIARTFNLTEEPTVYSVPFTSTNADKTSFGIMIYGESEKAFDIYVTNIKFEKGNKATDWTPAPEDIDKKFTDIEGTLASHSTKIEQNAQQIQLRATKTEVDTLSGRVNTVESTIQQHAGMIASKVEKSEFDSVTNTLGNRVSTIEQTADSISLEVSNIKANVYTKSEVDSAIDGIQVGGRNYLLNSDFSQGQNGWRGFSSDGFKLIEDSEGNYVQVSKTGETSVGVKASLYNNGKMPCEKGDKIVISGLVKVTSWDELDSQHFFIYEEYNATGTRVSYQDVQFTSPNVELLGAREDNVWIPFIFTKTVQHSDTVEVGLRYAIFKNGEISYKNWKLEKGNKATDWTPAPEDLTNPENIISRINLAPSGVTIQGDKIDFLGNAVFQSLTTTEAGTTVIDGGKIATNSILAKSIKANGLKVYNNSGQLMTEIKSDGTIWAKNGYFEGQINATSGTFTGTVNATSGTFNGTIYANSGRIGAWDITSGGLVSYDPSNPNRAVANIQPDSIYLSYGSGYRIDLWAYNAAISMQDINGRKVFLSTSNLQIETSSYSVRLRPTDGLYISRANGDGFYPGELVYITYFNVSEGNGYGFTTLFRPEALLFLVRDKNSQTATMLIPRDYISTSYDYTIMTDPDTALDFEFTSFTDTSYQFRYIGDWVSGSNISYVRIYAIYRRV